MLPTNNNSNDNIHSLTHSRTFVPIPNSKTSSPNTLAGFKSLQNIRISTRPRNEQRRFRTCYCRPNAGITRRKTTRSLRVKIVLHVFNLVAVQFRVSTQVFQGAFRTFSFEVAQEVHCRTITKRGTLGGPESPACGEKPLVMAVPFRHIHPAHN